MLVAAGSWRLLLGPLRIRTPFRYHEKLVSGVMVKLLWQLKVTACPSTTSEAGLMRTRAPAEDRERKALRR